MPEEKKARSKKEKRSIGHMLGGSARQMRDAQKRRATTANKRRRAAKEATRQGKAIIFKNRATGDMETMNPPEGAKDAEDQNC